MDPCCAGLLACVDMLAAFLTNCIRAQAWVATRVPGFVLDKLLYGMNKGLQARAYKRLALKKN